MLILVRRWILIWLISFLKLCFQFHPWHDRRSLLCGGSEEGGDGVGWGQVNAPPASAAHHRLRHGTREIGYRIELIERGSRGGSRIDLQAMNVNWNIERIYSSNFDSELAIFPEMSARSWFRQNEDSQNSLQSQSSVARLQLQCAFFDLQFIGDEEDMARAGEWIAHSDSSNCNSCNCNSRRCVYVFLNIERSFWS